MAMIVNAEFPVYADDAEVYEFLAAQHARAAFRFARRSIEAVAKAAEAAE